MLGEVIAVKARAIVSLGKPQPAGKQLAMRDAGVVHVVENAEFHGIGGRRTDDGGRMIEDSDSLLSYPSSVVCPLSSANRPSSVLRYFHSSLTISYALAPPGVTTSTCAPFFLPTRARA